MPRRRLEDRIQDLAGEAVSAKNPEESSDFILQLRAALHEHAERLRKLAAEKLILLPGRNGHFRRRGEDGDERRGPD